MIQASDDFATGISLKALLANYLYNKDASSLLARSKSNQ
jgi:hypothetical protein